MGWGGVRPLLTPRRMNAPFGCSLRAHFWEKWTCVTHRRCSGLFAPVGGRHVCQTNGYAAL